MTCALLTHYFINTDNNLIAEPLWAWYPDQRRKVNVTGQFRGIMQCVFLQISRACPHVWLVWRCSSSFPILTESNISTVIKSEIKTLSPHNWEATSTNRAWIKQKKLKRLRKDVSNWEGCMHIVAWKSCAINHDYICCPALLHPFIHPSLSAYLGSERGGQQLHFSRDASLSPAISSSSSGGITRRAQASRECL